MSQYANISNIKNNNIIYKLSVIYPEIPITNNDLYIISAATDRLDNLALQFYNDPTLYWIIQIANPNYIDKSSLFLNIGSAD